MGAPLRRCFIARSAVAALLAAGDGNRAARSTNPGDRQRWKIDTATSRPQRVRDVQIACRIAWCL
jgi:hypothetical protein